MPAAATRTKHEAYCPHCFLLVEHEVKGEWPEHPVRCPHCRLLIGPGRAREAAEANPGEVLGSRPERLLMVDYQQHASGDDSLPTLSDVFSAFGSWKRARREAAV